jgi:hypothetical protein
MPYTLGLLVLKASPQLGAGGVRYWFIYYVYPDPGQSVIAGCLSGGMPCCHINSMPNLGTMRTLYIVLPVGSTQCQD